MINGLGIVGWGVGGIEAEAGMLGQPVYFLTPDVVGVHLTGALREGVTATDLALTRHRRCCARPRWWANSSSSSARAPPRLPVVDRATIANMAPEYGATMGFFPIDEECVRLPARHRPQRGALPGLRELLPGPGPVRHAQARARSTTPRSWSWTWRPIVPSVAGPKRPQDRIELPALKQTFRRAVLASRWPRAAMARRRRNWTGTCRSRATRPPTSTPSGPAGTAQARGRAQRKRDARPASGPGQHHGQQQRSQGCELRHGTVLIAAITSCTNTSNPSVMLAAGLLAKKAVERGLTCQPGGQDLAGPRLARGDRLPAARPACSPTWTSSGFHLVGYGCTTCIGNSGPLEAHLEEAMVQNDLVAASVLSGNRNFEARVHQSIKANFLMSPPLVVAFALAGRVDIDLTREPLGTGKDGQPVFLQDVWPTLAGGPRPAAGRPQAGGLPRALPRFRRAESEVERNPGHRRRGLPVGPDQHLHPGAAVLHSASPAGPAPSPKSRARAPWPSSATASPPTTSRPAGAIKKTSPGGHAT